MRSKPVRLLTFATSLALIGCISAGASAQFAPVSIFGVTPSGAASDSAHSASFKLSNSAHFVQSGVNYSILEIFGVYQVYSDKINDPTAAAPNSWKNSGVATGYGYMTPAGQSSAVSPGSTSPIFSWSQSTVTTGHGQNQQTTDYTGPVTYGFHFLYGLPGGGTNTGFFSPTGSVVPEAGTFLSLGILTAGAGLALLRRRRVQVSA